MRCHMSFKIHLIISAIITVCLIAFMYFSQTRKEDNLFSKFNLTSSANIKKETEGGMFTEKELKSLKFVPSDIIEATLFIDVFDVNGESFSNKLLYINGNLIGIIPPNAPPITTWQTASINLPKEVAESLSSNNTIGVIDETKDFYNIKNLSLRFKIKGYNKFVVLRTTNTFSSAPDFWPYKQGKSIKLDGSPFINIPINLKK